MKITLDKVEESGLVRVVAANIDGEDVAFSDAYVHIRGRTELESIKWEDGWGNTHFVPQYDNDHAIIVTLDGRRLYPDELLLRDKERWVRYQRTDEDIQIEIGDLSEDE